MDKPEDLYLQRVVRGDFQMKSYQLYRFFARNSGMPSYIIFHVTSLCNSRCITCFNWKNLNKKDELKLDEIGKVSEKMKHIGYLTLGGGEPFLRKDLPEICEIFYKNNRARAFSIPTNGPSPDGIRKTHDNLRILAATTFCSHNQDKVIEIYRYIKEEMDIDQYNINYVRGDARNPIVKDVDAEKYEGLVNYIENNMDKKGNGLIESLFDILPLLTRRKVLETLKSEERIYECHAGKRMIVIDSFGNVFPCEMLSEKLGNLRDYDYDLQKILEMENTQRVLKYIRDKKCNCTWECAIQDSIVYDYKHYPQILKSVVLNK